MAAYVLIHGGGHGGWCYDKVTRLLKAKGHDVYAPSLTGCGDRAHLFPGSGQLYGVTDPADLAWMDELLTPHAWRCFEQKLDLQHEDELWATPQFHLVCTSTIESRGAELIEKARADGRLWDIDTGHDLMITEPEKVTAVLEEIAVR